MLIVLTGVNGATGYVTTEQRVGEPHGLDGSFALQHGGTKRRERPTLSVTRVSDSGTGQLAGIAGTLPLDIVESTHRYAFQYALADAG